MKGDYVVCGLTAAIVVWNCFAAPKGEEVSYVLRRWSEHSHLVPFLFGLLMGHVFWHR